jgi:secreted PhoX family phosphatase
MPRAFIPSTDFAAEANSDDEIRENLRGVAQEVADDATRNAEAVGAPWMPRPGHELVEVTEDEDGDVFVVNTDYGAHLQEFGSVNNPVHAPLRRAAIDRGLEVDETPE